MRKLGEKGAPAPGELPDAFVHHWADELVLAQRELVLDVGCGGGRNALYLAGRGFRVWGVDRSRARLAEAVAHAQHRHLELVLIQGDLGHLPLASASCATILCAHVLESLPREELGQGLAEFHRVLKPRGQLLLITVAREGSHPEEGEEMEPNTFLFRGHGPETKIHFATHEELKKWLPGFRIIEMVHQRWVVPSMVPLGGQWIVVAEKVP